PLRTSTPALHDALPISLPMSCPYLPDREERRLVCDLSTRRGRHAHDALAHAGFRRTQHLAYRPACVGCAGCVPVRLRVTDFRWTDRKSTRLNSSHVKIS